MTGHFVTLEDRGTCHSCVPSLAILRTQRVCGLGLWGLEHGTAVFLCTGALARVQVFGKWHSVPRKQATYGDAGLTYTFSGLTLSPKPWIPVLERVRDRVSGLTGQTFNFVLVNR